jgi:two-component system cell cycle sensor histidine kinase/response regulator CckA
LAVPWYGIVPQRRIPPLVLAVPRARRARGRGAQLESLAILIIEAKGGIARALLAGRPGFTTLHAERMAKAEALAAPARAAGGFAAIVIDLALPDCQGLEAYRRAAALHPGTPMVALQRASDAGPADTGLSDTLMAEGAQACLEYAGLDGGALAAAVRQAILRRRAELKRFRAFFDAAPMGILLAAGRRVLMANAAAQELLGYDEAEFAVMSALEPFPPAARPILEGSLDAPAPADARFSADLARKDGSPVRCRVHVAAATLNDAPVAALFLTPLVGELSPLPGEIAAAGIASGSPAGTGAAGGPARQALKMEAVGRLAEGVAHDFGNLLTAINGYSEHLLASAGGGSVASGLRAINRAGEEAADLTRKLIGFTQSDGGETGPVAVGDALRGMEDSLRRMLGPEIDLRLEAEGAPEPIVLEPGSFQSIIMALCANARDAMPRGGILRVTVETADIGPGTAFTHLHAGPGAAVAITVEDQGIGMGPETLERLFEPFYSTKRGGRARGTGLTSVYGIVRRAGGGITVESEPGSGTRIRILFPRGIPRGILLAKDVATSSQAGAPASPGSVASAAAAAAAAGATSISDAGTVGSAGPEGPGGTILVVEDEPSLREMLQAILMRTGYAVLAAGSGEEAEEIVARPEIRIDLIVTDVMLRGEDDGDALIARLQTLRPGLRALFMSGHTLEGLAERGIRIPPDAFLEKPFTPALLAARVSSLLAAARKPA